MKRLNFFIILALFTMLAVNAQGDDLYPFPSKAMQTEFEELTQKLRCLVCQNQNIADSDAPLAHDLRRDVYERLLQGEHADQIMQRLAERYGDFILFQPPVNHLTWLLWWGPIGLLMLCLAGVVYRVRRGSGANV